MTPRENLLRAARREDPEWITFDFSVSREKRKEFQKRLGEDFDLCEHFQFDARWLGPMVGTRRPTPDWRALYYSDGSLPAEAVVSDEWGTASLHHAETDDDLRFSPLRDIQSVEDFEAYPWPDDVGAPFRYEGVAERVAAVHKQGLASVVSGLDFFEFPVRLCSFETLLTGMAGDELWARQLFAKHAEGLVRTAEQVARSGADILKAGSDVATQQVPLMSPAMWWDWVFPLMRDSIAAAKAIKPDILVLYHSDGNVEPLIEGFIEAGVDILDPLQPECMDIFALKERYGDRLSFHGGIGVQSVLPFGSADEVRDTVRRTIDGMSTGGGGYLCSPSHKIRPEVPWANVMALVETVREYGHP